MFPSCAAYLIELERLGGEVDSIPIAPFFEPIALLHSRGWDEPAELLALDAATLTSWAAHLSSGCRVRMRALENAVYHQLAEKQLLPAMALARAHLETAGFVTYGLERVGHCADKGNVDEMKEIIPKMLFGTSFKCEKKAEALQELIEFSDQRPVWTSTLIDAMDRFAEQTDTPSAHYYRILYAILCEYAHPTMRSLKPFCEVTKETTDGWHLTYSYKESVTDTDIANALMTLISSMQAGYGSALLLGSWQFADGQDGIHCRKAPPDFGKWVWEKVLHSQFDLRFPDPPSFGFGNK